MIFALWKRPLSLDKILMMLI